MRKGECENSDDGQQQGSIVNVRFLMKLFLWKLDYDDHDWGGVGLGSNHVHGDNEE